MRLKFVSIPAVFLFFISSVSTFLILPTAKSLRSYTSSSYRTIPYKYEISASQADVSVEPTGNKYQSVENLAKLCHTFASKNIKQSTTSDRTQWANDGLFQQIIASLDSTSFLTASTFGSFLLMSPFPTNSIIFQGNNYALSLLMIPRGVEVQLPTSDKDNTFIYKPLRGLGELRKQKEQGSSEVIRMNGNDDFNTLYNDVLIESGGDRRNFKGQQQVIHLTFWLPSFFFSFIRLHFIPSFLLSYLLFCLLSLNFFSSYFILSSSLTSFISFTVHHCHIHHYRSR
jgi:hypothetical protein